MKPNKRNGRAAKLRRQEAAKDRADNGAALLKEIQDKHAETKEN